jgi:hypothetical protein
MTPRLDLRYSLLTVAYLATIYWLSAIPDLSTGEQHPLVLLVLNLGHTPLFAGLAFCVLKSIWGAPDMSSAPYALAFVASAASAALDEWHQSFVPGRHCSMGDFLVDLAGIGGMLFFLRLHALRKERRPAVTSAVCCVRQP